MYQIFFIYQLFILTIHFSYFIKLSYQQTFSGIATAYGGKIYGGSCGFTHNNYIYGVAINANQYNNSLTCGTCINIKYSNTNINAIVTDICPECKYGDLDLFEETYNSLINKPFGREIISWSFINCPLSSSIELKIDEINYYWLSIRPENIKCQLSEIYINQNNKWILMQRDDNIMKGLYFIYNKKLIFPMQFKLINLYNEEIVSPLYYDLSNTLYVNNQFNCNNQFNNNNNEFIIDC